MKRQCAWCGHIFSLGTTGNHVTHGICEQCAEHIRRSMQHMRDEVTSHSEAIRLATNLRDGSLVL